MIERLLNGSYTNTKLYHVRMSFSKDMDDMGTWRLGKVLHAVSIVCKVAYLRVRHNIHILYYPPSGPDCLPMLRDIAILGSVRWMFKKTVFHFHAAGTSELYGRLPGYLKIIYRWAYLKPDVAILLSKFNPDDGATLQARKTLVIANGIEDEYASRTAETKRENPICTVLFVGLICQSKGILDLIEAVSLVKTNGLRVKVNVVGKFSSAGFRQAVNDRIMSYGLGEDFDFKGVLTGSNKAEQFLNADIFCFPTFFESESFGLVVVEAMQFCLPVIATSWRGVQSLVVDGKTGFLVPPHDSGALADKIFALASDPDLRRKMGSEGRKQYLQKFTLEKFHSEIDECFATL